ncbi:MAG: hypothetical protein KAU62_17385 [Candidatus Heimdallarchaeota archaeon]|nr:hypothetical protein [Candidatus Heimdallarchaeota archaeon]MCG3257882.1 hypothetical protein [Candidatus Heimdallarchaeota archaeon]MCK4612933.1 hypothetical protein [Candidatus Heimdallarchaeota archaeon]
MITSQDLVDTTNKVYERALKEADPLVKELVTAIFGDFIMGGLVAGGIFVLIDTTVDYNVLKLSLGLVCVSVGIIAWLIRFFVKKRRSRIM